MLTFIMPCYHFAFCLFFLFFSFFCLLKFTFFFNFVFLFIIYGYIFLYTYNENYWLFCVMQFSFNFMFFIYFMMAEFLFFVCLFTTYFWLMYSTNNIVGFEFSTSLNVYSLPFLNLLLLLTSSGLFIVFCHLIRRFFNLNIFMVILLGCLFMYVQYVEYLFSMFSMDSMVYWNLFYLITGMHGFHVILGLCLIFLFSYCYIINIFVFPLTLSSIDIYWHFVDLIWVFVWFFVYWSISVF